MNQHVSEIPFVIRPMRENDTPALAELHKRAILAAYPSHYPHNVVDAWANSRSPERYLKAQAKGERFLVYELDGKLVGFISWNNGELCAMYIDPDHHRQGIGKLLIAAAVVMARIEDETPISWVKAALPAQGFYEKMGFVFKEFGTSTICGHTIQDALLEYRLPE